MDKLDKVVENVSVVFIGQFNPLVFSPNWFLKNGCIPGEDFETLTKGPENSVIVNSAVASFQTDTFQIEVTNQRFAVFLKKAPFEAVIDFYKGAFAGLGALPINRFGINYLAHYQFKTSHDMQFFADTLTPKKEWASLLGDEISGDDRKSGLVSVAMMKAKDKTDLDNGHITMTIQGSPLIKQLGILMDINDDYRLKQNSSADDAVYELQSVFHDSVSKSVQIQEDLINAVFNK